MLQRKGQLASPCLATPIIEVEPPRCALAGWEGEDDKLRLGKTPAVYAGVASAVSFMGPKWRQPPMFYFSLTVETDADVLDAASLTSVGRARSQTR